MMSLFVRRLVVRKEGARMHMSAKCGWAALVLAVVSLGGGAGGTALPGAAQRRDAQAGPAAAMQASQRQTALMWAATAQTVEIAQALVEKGADVNARSRTGFTPLMFAAREGSLELSRLLLASGAGLNASDAAGMTPLLIATVR